MSNEQASDKAKAKRKRDELNAERGAAWDPWHRGGSAYDDTAEPLRPLPHQLYRFDDLKQRRIVNNRAQLAKMIERDGFPPGFILSPQTRAWRADDIEAWLQSRPTEQIKPRGRAKALVEKASAKNGGEAA